MTYQLVAQMRLENKSTTQQLKTTANNLIGTNSFCMLFIPKKKKIQQEHCNPNFIKRIWNQNLNTLHSMSTSKPRHTILRYIIFNLKNWSWHFLCRPGYRCETRNCDGYLKSEDCRTTISAILYYEHLCFW